MTKRNIVQGELILTEAGLRRMKSTPVLASMIYDTSILRVGSNILSSSQTTHGRLKRMFSTGDNHISYKIYEPILKTTTVIVDTTNDGLFLDNAYLLVTSPTGKTIKIFRKQQHSWSAGQQAIFDKLKGDPRDRKTNHKIVVTHNDMKIMLTMV